MSPDLLYLSDLSGNRAVRLNTLADSSLFAARLTLDFALAYGIGGVA